MTFTQNNTITKLMKRKYGCEVNQQHYKCKNIIDHESMYVLQSIYFLQSFIKGIFFMQIFL